MDADDKDLMLDIGEAGLDIVASACGLGPLAIAGKLGRKAVGRSLTRLANERTERFFENLAAAMNFGNADVVEAYLFENIDEPWLRGNLVESFKNLIGALDEAVIPAIAKLTAKYFQEHRSPDPFARNAGRILMDMDHRDLAAMNDVIKAVLSNPLVVVNHMLEHAPKDSFVTAVRGEVARYVLVYLREDHKESDKLIADDEKGYARNLELLKRHALAWSEPPASFGTISGVGQMTMHIDTANRLFEIIRL